MRPTIPSPSSHRTCGFPASGVPKDLCRRHAHRSTLPMLGLLAQLGSRRRESFLRKEDRSGKPAQSELPSFYPDTSLAGPLRSTGITPLPRYYAPRRLPIRTVRTVMFSRSPLGLTHPLGSPRFPADRSVRAAPSHPGGPDRCVCSLLPGRWQASPYSGRLATLILCNEAETGSIACGSYLRRTRLRTPDYSDARSFGYLSNEQFTEQAPFSL